MRNLTATSGQLQLLYWCKDGGGIPYVRGDQTVSIVTSILSLAWCFTSYHATLKRGALDKDLAALFYRAVLFLGNLFQILGKVIYSKYCKHLAQQIRFLCVKMSWIMGYFIFIPIPCHSTIGPKRFWIVPYWFGIESLQIVLV